MVNHTALDRPNIVANVDNSTTLHINESHTHQSSCPIHQFHQEPHLVKII